MPRSFRYLTPEKRIKLQDSIIEGHTQKEIAQRPSVSQSTISRELKRNKVGTDTLYNPISAYRAVKSRMYPEMTERKVLRRRGKRKYKRGGGKTLT